MEKEDERQRAEDAEREREEAGEEDRRAVEDFEKTMLGLEGGRRSVETPEDAKVSDRSATKGVKRKFELDEEEMMKSVRDGRMKARRAMDDERVPTHIAPGSANTNERSLEKVLCLHFGSPR